MKSFKTILYIFIFLPVLMMSAVSCSDDIYFKISKELPLIEPRIKGSPTNFVMFNGEMYVATGKNIFIYNETENKWTNKSLSHNITQLAATSSRIYALCYVDKKDDVERKILWCDKTKIANWEWDEDEVPPLDNTEKYTIMHFIYSANDKLYIGA